MTNKLKTKTAQVLLHLQKKKSITSWQAIANYRATRLADIVYRLKDKGHNIMSVPQKKDGEKWVKYVYMGQDAK